MYGIRNFYAEFSFFFLFGIGFFRMKIYDLIFNIHYEKYSFFLRNKHLSGA